LEEAACERTIGKLLVADRKHNLAAPHLKAAFDLRHSNQRANPLDVAISAQELAENELATWNLSRGGSPVIPAPKELAENELPARNLAGARSHVDKCIQILEQKLGLNEDGLADAYLLKSQIEDAAGCRHESFLAIDGARRAARRFLDRYLPSL